MSAEYAHSIERRMEDTGITCSIDEFVKAERDSPHFRNRIEIGHVYNLLDAALEEIERLRRNRKHIWRQGYTAGKDDQRSNGQTVTTNPYWRDETP